MLIFYPFCSRCISAASRKTSLERWWVVNPYTARCSLTSWSIERRLSRFFNKNALASRHKGLKTRMMQYHRLSGPELYKYLQKEISVETRFDSILHVRLRAANKRPANYYPWHWLSIIAAVAGRSRHKTSNNSLNWLRISNDVFRWRSPSSWVNVFSINLLWPIRLHEMSIHPDEAKKNRRLFSQSRRHNMKAIYVITQT